VSVPYGANLLISNLSCLGSAQRCKDKIEHTSTNIPLLNDTKIVSVLQRVDGEVAFTNFVIQKRDGQTKKQKRKSNFSTHGGARYPSPTKLGTVIEEVRIFLASPKHVRLQPTVSPLGALKIWGNAQTPSANPPKF